MITHSGSTEGEACRQKEGDEGRQWGRGEKSYQDKEGFYVPIYTLCTVFCKGISEKYWRINYGTFLFISLPVHLLLPHLPYPIYFEVLSVLSSG